MIKRIPAKTILIKNKSNYWFHSLYTVNLYRGCSHKCIYCDSRSSCYNIENFDDILVKENAIGILEYELRKAKVKGTIATGSMSDPYQQIEKKELLTRRFLEIIDKYSFPLVIVTKSDLVLRDLELLKSINDKAKVTVAFTITTMDEKTQKIVEPNVSNTKKRLNAMKILSDNGIYTGVLMQPILPFINDTEENIRRIVKESYENGAKFVLPLFGVTLRDRQRDYYYKKLDKYFPGLKEKYQDIYKENYLCYSKNIKTLNKAFNDESLKFNLITRMENVDYWIDNNPIEQLSLFN